MKKDAKYEEWFGRHNGKREKRVKKVYGRIVTVMSSTSLNYDLSKTGCENNWYAYTYPGGDTVWPCKLFWSAPANGLNSKAGTVVHEWSHALGDTDDVDNIYGEDDCRELAETRPDDAVNNADNFEYYAES